MLGGDGELQTHRLNRREAAVTVKTEECRTEAPGRENGKEEIGV